MKVLVIGAHGQVGQIVVDLLQQSEKYKPVAMVRTEERAKLFKNKGVETVIADLEGPIHKLRDAMKLCDTIIFTAGSGGHTGAEKTLLVDLDGAVKAIEAAEQMELRRFIMVSALQAHRRENWHEQIRPYYVAKHYADRILEASDIIYTIVRPGTLSNREGTGKIAVADNLDSGLIPREDVAKTLVAAIDEENVYNRSFDLLAGDVEISTALSELV